MDTTAGPVVAAIDHRGWLTVVDHAVAEAVRRQAALHLVHAERPAAQVSTGAALLTLATRRASDLVGRRAPVTATLAAGEPVAAVAEAAATADLVVVGRSAPGRRGHAGSRSVTVGLAAHALAPVLSVPDRWAHAMRTPTVVAGVDDPERADDVLAAAVAAARTRAARLVVLTASWRPPGAGSAPLTQVSDLGTAERSGSALRAALSRYGVPAELPVELVHVEEPAPQALVAAARTASLVVLGRHETLLSRGSHVGPVARAVVRDARCPVLLAAPHDRHLVARAGHGFAATV